MLNRNSDTTTARVIRDCSSCRQALRLPADRRGVVRCPTCKKPNVFDTFIQAERLCRICGHLWIGGRVLIDGGVYHQSCYDELIRLTLQLEGHLERIDEDLCRLEAEQETLAGWLPTFKRYFSAHLQLQERQLAQVRALRNAELLEQLSLLKQKRATFTAQLHDLHDRWPNYPPDWAQRREEVKAYKGFECAQCGVTHDLHLHHKKPIREGGTHCVENLVFLCEEHHRDAHGGREFSYRDRVFSTESRSDIAIEKRIGRINDAIATKRDIRFRYEKFDGTITKRTVTPLQLRKLITEDFSPISNSHMIGGNEGSTCLFSYCHLRKAQRTFAVHRIRKLHLV